MNCLFLLVLLSCCGGYGSRRTNGCPGICPREGGEEQGCGCGDRGNERSGGRNDRSQEQDCGCNNRREERGQGGSDRRDERDCGCNDRRDERNGGQERRGEECENCNCDRRFAESRPMSRYDDTMRGCSMGDSVPEMGQQGRNQYAGYPEN